MSPNGNRTNQLNISFGFIHFKKKAQPSLHSYIMYLFV